MLHVWSPVDISLSWLAHENVAGAQDMLSYAFSVQS